MAKLLLPSHLSSFALVSRTWRQAILPLVTILHVPMLSEVTLPSGPIGSQQIDVVDRYLRSLQDSPMQQQQQQIQRQRRASPRGHARSSVGGSSSPGGAAASPSVSGAAAADNSTIGANATPNPKPRSGNCRGTGAADANGTAAITAAGPGAAAGPLDPGAAPARPASGISPPLLQKLRRRFPFARTVGLHRSQLQHPRMELAALRGLSACEPHVTELHMYDTLAWDFPQQLTNLGSLTQLVTLKLWSLGAPGLDPSAQVGARAERGGRRMERP